MENLWGFYVLPVAPLLTMFNVLLGTQTHTHILQVLGGVGVHPRPFETRNASVGYEGEGADYNGFFLFTSGAKAH